MYIKTAHIQNIRSIKELTLDFGDDPSKMAGWHVLIGENGSGKTTVLRCLALALLCDASFPLNSKEWLRHTVGKKLDGSIILNVRRDADYDNTIDNWENLEIPARFNFWSIGDEDHVIKSAGGLIGAGNRFLHSVIDKGSHWFSIGLGSSRKFRGSNAFLESIAASDPRTGAHLSLFFEEAALTQIEPWLIKLDHKRLRNENGHIIPHMFTLLNDKGLLPDGTILKEITADGLIFQDGNGAEVSLHQLSDGYRSVLSITMELIRQLIRVYGEDKAFEAIDEEGSAINHLPGVVLIDEIDAHLHPTWQTGIGQRLTELFPMLQFIVTTHSPLICRACGENGRIWHLRSPGSKEKSRKVEGSERDKLVYGDVLDAYDTNLFGEDIERGDEGQRAKERYRELSYKERYGVPLTESETQELERYNQLFKFNVEGTGSRVK